MSNVNELDLMIEISEKLSSLKFMIGELGDSLNRIEMLYSFGTYLELKRYLPDIFKNVKQIMAYELSNGEMSTRDIGNLVGVDQKTVSTWWRNWESNFNIVEKVGKRGQYKNKYSLLELAIRFSSEEINSESINHS